MALSEPTPHFHPLKPEQIDAIKLTNKVKARAATFDDMILQTIRP